MGVFFLGGFYCFFFGWVFRLPTLGNTVKLPIFLWSLIILIWIFYTYGIFFLLVLQLASPRNCLLRWSGMMWPRSREPWKSSKQSRLFPTYYNCHLCRHQFAKVCSDWLILVISIHKPVSIISWKDKHLHIWLKSTSL